MLVQLFADIVVNAALYGLLLVGYQLNSLLKGVGNFAFGALVALAGYLYWYGRTVWGANGIWPALVAMAGALAMSLAFEAVFMWFLAKRRTGTGVALMVGIALLGIAQAFVQAVFGASAKAVQIWHTGWSGFGISLTYSQALLCAAGLGLLGAAAGLLTGSPAGLRFRAVGDGSRSAQALGVSVRSVTWTATALAAIPAALAGIFITTERSLNPETGMTFVIVAFVLAAIAGRDVRLWLPSCLMLSAFEVAASWFFGSAMASVILYAFIFLFLVSGRFGRGVAVPKERYV
jgi:branched-chain amino acid transport system permease protein